MVGEKVLELSKLEREIFLRESEWDEGKVLEFSKIEERKNYKKVSGMRGK